MSHYKTLQVDRDAEPEVIEKAYKALCMKYHPDRSTPTSSRSGDDATIKMQRINAAYAVLKDSKKRAVYDRGLEYPAGASAWDHFLEKGLVGMLWDKMERDRD
ncbi:MAG: DnaJ domain-containing protein [Actinobacteria bacterium]|nr:DnaJ domain-containing protein [Actinomycetota bacterium]MCL5887372.1 DnaJ domain-containing protein [Actinomycetota bacterium]